MLLNIQHIAIHVKNLEASTFFYNKILNLPIIERPKFDFDGMWFSVGTSQEIHLIAGLSKPVNSDSRGNHFAFQTPSIIEFENHLLAFPYPYKPAKQRPDGAWQIFIKDPDEYVIEIYQEINKY
ncbi:MAG: glyoxalase [Cytophagales bacterium]|nr:MAG: glyoxalase [Cytophagales bacterium]